jgi:hypothetical protein
MGARCTLFGSAPGAAVFAGAVSADAREAVDQPVTAPGVLPFPLAAVLTAGDGQPAVVYQVGDRLLDAGQVQAASAG